jgi:integrase/recombinase XerD
MTPLRQRFIEDLQRRNRAPRTIESYVAQLKQFAAFFNQSPDQLGSEQVHRYFVHLLNEKKVSWSTYNQAVSALRFFYTVTCPRDGMVVRLPYGKRTRKLPVVRSAEDIARFLAAVRGRANRMLLRTIYATGLRLDEALRLTSEQIDSRQMLLRVLGKGRKERLLPLSPALLEELRAYYRATRPKRWLFPGKTGQRPLRAGTVQRACAKACWRAGLPRITPHTLRHCYATRLLEAGVDIRRIQVLLGHTQMTTTMLYTHATVASLRDIVSPLEQLPPLPKPK